MKSIVILGSTGSIGRQTLDIVRSFPNAFKVIGLATGYNLKLLAEQIQEFKPRFVCCAGDEKQGIIPNGVTFVSMEEMVCHPDVDLVMVATIGKVGLLPTLEALKAGKKVALANKEVIIMAGQLLSRVLGTRGQRLGTTPQPLIPDPQHPDSVPTILPVDSEPSAIWQCLQGEQQPIRRIIITASGGPFRTTPLEKLEHVTPEEALNHPTWRMGKKITIDSATLMNKAFEVIEAHWLFDLPWDKIEVVVHPQSIIHSMVEFVDGSVKAQLGPPDMRLPIQYSLFYPTRLPNEMIPRLDTSVPRSLTFEPLDTGRYPCFSLATEAGKKGGTYPAVLSAADEVAVELFLAGQIGFMDIYRVVERVLEEHIPSPQTNLEEILLSDQWARAKAREVARSK